MGRLVHTKPTVGRSHVLKQYLLLASFPGLPWLQVLITCSMQKRSQKAWWISPRDPRQEHHAAGTASYDDVFYLRAHFYWESMELWRCCQKMIIKETARAVQSFRLPYSLSCWMWLKFKKVLECSVILECLVITMKPPEWDFVYTWPLA